MRNRQELEASILQWLNREDADTTARVKDFITLAEQRIFYGTNSGRYTAGLRCRENEAFESISNIGARDYKFEVPEALLEVRALTLNDEALTPASTLDFFSANNESGKARFYTRVRDASAENYEIWPKGETPQGIVNLYYYVFLALGDQADATNLILQRHPSIYLYGALCEAAPYLKFAEEIAIWEGKFGSAMDSAMRLTQDSEYAGGITSVSSIYGD